MKGTSKEHEDVEHTYVYIKGLRPLPWTLEVHVWGKLSDQWTLVQVRNRVSSLAFLYFSCFLMATEHLKCTQAK